MKILNNATILFRVPKMVGTCSVSAFRSSRFLHAGSFVREFVNSSDTSLRIVSPSKHVLAFYEMYKRAKKKQLRQLHLDQGEQMRKEVGVLLRPIELAHSDEQFCYLHPSKGWQRLHTSMN
jgi:hypothetical protein